MRSFAVLAVLFDHTYMAMDRGQTRSSFAVSLGTFGVYLFFVHTTLVLMWSLERQPDTLSFYIRRAFRIYPLAIFAVAVTVLFRIPAFGLSGIFVRPPTEWPAILSNLFLVHNLLHYPNVEMVLWTLPLEVQMYIGLPALFAFARKEQKLWPLVTLWGAAAVCAYCLLPRAFDIQQFFAFIPNFIPGAVAFVSFMSAKRRWPAWAFGLLLGALTIAYVLRPSRPMGWICCLVLGLLIPHFRPTRNLLLCTIGHAVAKYSYGIYLLHLWAIAIGFYYLPLHHLWAKVTIELLCVAVLAPLAYRLIEKPAMDFGARIARRVLLRAIAE
jgi:peptidoglycan/LPS O-acetylase OafA/YrhL